MKEIIHQLLMGYSSLFLAVAGRLPRPGLRITLPPESASQGIGYDFQNIIKDFQRSVVKIENAKQLELELQAEQHSR